MRREFLLLIAVVILALLPRFVSAYWVGLMTQALIFGAFAMGLDLLVGYTGLLSLGHAAFFGLAGYGAALAITRWSLDPWLAAGLGIGLSVLVALAYAPLAVRLGGLALLTVTLAFGQVVWGLATRWTTFTGGENGVPGVSRPVLPIGSLDIADPIVYYWFSLFWIVLLMFLISRFAHSPVGLSLLGVRDSDTRMSALGYDVHRRKVTAFVVAAAVGAVCGVLSTYFNKFVGPGSLDWRLSAQMLLSVVIGGPGSLWGPFVAGSGLFIIRTQLVGETQRWVMVLGFLYIITVLVLPGGLASIPVRIRNRRISTLPSAAFDSTGREGDDVGR